MRHQPLRVQRRGGQQKAVLWLVTRVGPRDCRGPASAAGTRVRIPFPELAASQSCRREAPEDPPGR